MHISSAAILEAVTLSSALSLDAFVASFAYGSRGIKIPLRSVQTINLICGVITGISLFLGSILRHYIPAWLTATVGFALLFLLGIVKLMDSITKSIIRRHNDLSREIRFSLFNFKFILNLYANPEDADIDGSKALSPSEAASLAVALSLDGITVGLGAAIGNVNGPAVFLSSLVINLLAVLLGGFVGNRAARSASFDLSWLSGALLIFLAFAKLS